MLLEQPPSIKMSSPVRRVIEVPSPVDTPPVHAGGVLARRPVPSLVGWPVGWIGGRRRTLACSFLHLAQTVAEIGEAALPSSATVQRVPPGYGRE